VTLLSNPAYNGFNPAVPLHLGYDAVSVVEGDITALDAPGMIAAACELDASDGVDASEAGQLP